MILLRMSDYTREWFDWLELDEKWLPKLTESLKNIEIDGLLRKMSWEDLVAYLVSSWNEKVTKFVPSWAKKVTKSEKSYNTDNHIDNCFEGTSPNEKVTKSVSSSLEKSTKSLSKKLWYEIVILMLSGYSITIDELIEVFTFKHKTFFRENYLKPLESVGFITKTNPDKPTASNQKYVITEKGKRFLTGQEF